MVMKRTRKGLPMIIDHNPTAQKYGQFFVLPEGTKWEDYSYQYGHLKGAVYVSSQLAETWWDLYGDTDDAEFQQRREKCYNLAFIRSQVKEKDKWKRTGDTVKFSEPNSKQHIFLMDGAHRIKSIILEGAALLLDIVVGVENEAFAHMDTASSRSGADVLSSAGYHYPNDLAGTARMCLNYLAGNYGSMGKARGRESSNEDVLNFVDQHPELPNLVGDAVKLYHETILEDRLLTGRIQAGLTWIYSWHHKHPESLLNNFFERVYTGLDINSKTNPIFKLRAILRQHKDQTNMVNLTPSQIINLVMKALNLWLESKELKGALKWHPDEGFVGVLDVKDVKRKPRKSLENVHDSV